MIESPTPETFAGDIVAAQSAEDQCQVTIRSAKAWIFDMDGVLYRGTEPLPGVGDLFSALELQGTTIHAGHQQLDVDCR